LRSRTSRDAAGTNLLPGRLQERAGHSYSTGVKIVHDRELQHVAS
jgi:hypothetical protein